LFSIVLIERVKDVYVSAISVEKLIKAIVHGIISVDSSDLLILSSVKVILLVLEHDVVRAHNDFRTFKSILF
jgi:hypothetical protein